MRKAIAIPYYLERLKGINAEKKRGSIGKVKWYNKTSYQNIFSKVRTLSLRKDSHRHLRLMKSPIAGVI
jgi:hypothetical protein